jgi:hypothetical protein
MDIKNPATGHKTALIVIRIINRLSDKYKFETDFQKKISICKGKKLKNK